MAARGSRFSTRRLAALLVLAIFGWLADSRPFPWLGEAGLALGSAAEALAALAGGIACGAGVAGVVATASQPILSLPWWLTVGATAWVGGAVRRRIPSFLALLAFWVLLGVPALALRELAATGQLAGFDWRLALSRPLSGLVGLAVAEVALGSDRLRALVVAQPPYDGKRPLRALLLHGFVLLGALPALLLSARIGQTLFVEREQEAGRNLVATATRVAGAVDRLVSDHLSSLTTLSGELATGGDHAARVRLLEQHRRLFPAFQSLALVDTAGHLLAASPEAPTPHLHEPGLGVGASFRMSAPLRGLQGGVTGSVEGVLSPAAWRDLLAAERRTDAPELFLLDADRRPVASSPGSLPALSMEAWRAAPGSPAPPGGRSWRVAIDPHGDEQLVAEATTRSGWSVAARRPRAELRAEGNRLLLGTLGVALALLAAALVLAVYSLASVARPIEALARDLSALDLDRPGHPMVPAKTPAREVDRLARSVEALRERLRASYAGLAEALEARNVTNYELKRLLDQMDRKVQARTVELAEAKEHAEQLGRIKMEFLAHMSHEIRTPLNAVIGLTELLLQTALAPTQREYAETIRGSGEALLAVVNDVLDLSKIEEGKLEIESRPCDLETLLEEAVRLAAVRATDKDLEVFCERAHGTPRWVLADPVRLRQVFLNLLGNAVRLTAAGEVEVRLGQDARAERLRVSVRDTGPGIPPELKVRLYLPYSQLGQASTGSTGLGLAISRALVERMGGEIWTEGEPGRGSTFSFTFQAPATEAPTSEVSPPSLRGRTVLVLVRNAALRASLDRRLAAWGGRVESAPTLAQAAERVQRCEFDLALCDLDLDDGSALELVHRLQPRGRIPATVLLVPIGRVVPRTVSDAFAAMVTKPARTRDLAGAIAAALARHPPSAKEGRTLLVLADSPLERRLLRSLATRGGWRVEAPEAWRQMPASGVDPSAVVVAVSEPERAEELLAAFARERPSTARAAILHGAETAAPSAAQHTMTPPIDAPRLLALLGRLEQGTEISS